MDEHEHQCALFQWAKLNETATPELVMLHHNPLGWKRPKLTAVRLKAAGVKAGFPDISLHVPVEPYHGLFIELKVGRNKPTPAQQWWLDELKRHGYKTAVCYGWEEARDVILNYLGEDGADGKLEGH